MNSGTEIVIPLLALLATLAGVSLLYRSWQHRQGRWRRWVGWTCLLLATFVWSVWVGVEFGLVAGLCVPSVIALAQVFWHSRSDQASGRANGRVNGRTNNADSTTLPPAQGSPIVRTGHHLGRFLLVVPYAALAAFFTTLGMAMLLPWSELSRVTLLVIAAPAIWGLMAAWLCSDDRSWRPALAPDARPLYMVLHEAGSPAQFMEIYAYHPRRLIYGESYRFDTEGNYLGRIGFLDGEPGKQAIFSIYRLPSAGVL